MSSGSPETHPSSDPLLVSVNVQSTLDWDYQGGTSEYRRLFDRAARDQWNEQTAIDWELGTEAAPSRAIRLDLPAAWSTTKAKGLQDHFAREFQSWMVCQFLHGEQAALVGAARLAEAAPGVDAKLCFASQAADEARHVSVFSRYVDLAITDPYPPARELVDLLQSSLGSPEPDMVGLGIQILVEALALSCFHLGRRTFSGLLLHQILGNVARDEARHVTMGTVYIKERMEQLSSAEIRYREEFLISSVQLISQRFFLGDIWGRLGLDPDEGRSHVVNDPLMSGFRNSIFLRAVLCLRRIGILTPRLIESMVDAGFGAAVDAAQRLGASASSRPAR